MPRSLPNYDMLSKHHIAQGMSSSFPYMDKYLIYSLLIMALFASTDTTHAQQVDLKKYRWENRLLIVFAEDQTVHAKASPVNDSEKKSE